MTVSGAATQLESETSETGTVISPTEVRICPLNGRAYGDLATLAPGVRRNTLENQSVTSRDASFNVNGQRSEFNNFLLDGLDNNAYGTSNQGFSNQAIPPSPDAINEFRVETNNYSAEYGRASGAVINVSINSGTNQFHGRVWEYNRNTDLNAQGPFLPPLNVLTGQRQMPVLIRNQFGGAWAVPSAKTSSSSLSTMRAIARCRANTPRRPYPMRNSGRHICRHQRAPVPLRNPVTGKLYPNGVVPQSDWTPLATLVIAALPAPNVPNSFSNNYASLPKASLIDNKGDGRVDYYLNEKTTIFGRFSNHHGDIVDASSIPGLAGGGGNGTIHAYNKQLAGGVTHTFNQTRSSMLVSASPGRRAARRRIWPGRKSLNTQAGIPGLPTDKP